MAQTKRSEYRVVYYDYYDERQKPRALYPENEADDNPEAMGKRLDEYVESGRGL